MLGGLYQVVYNTTPCLTYEFTMYGQSRPTEGNDSLSALQVGIDRSGWHPDTASDPAVHNSFPSTTVWGDSHKYEFGYGLLSVSAEAWAEEIAVYTYADASGGTSHAILWDTGSLAEATPDLLSDPNNPPAASGISGLSASVGNTSATINWNTSVSAIGQVYYRFVSDNTTPVSSTTSFTHTVYLPLVNNEFPPSWHATDLNKTPSTSHSVTITGLQANTTYEYIVASRGLSGGQCATWVSSKKEFTTAP
jgi:hypothetical protein